jgi:long-subunit acyl-CoA synthetase (AMP-forming)
MRGGVISAGYFKLPDDSAETFDSDGWVHSGDLGAIDQDGFLSIVGRKKEIIINAAGKNMSPISIEAKVRAAGPLIAHCVVIGDGRPYNVALIVPDAEQLQALGPEAIRQGEVERIVGAAVELANTRMSRVEQIKRFTVLDEEWAPGGEILTPTSKVKRHVVAALYAGEIEDLYAG